MHSLIQSACIAVSYMPLGSGIVSHPQLLRLYHLADLFGAAVSGAILGPGLGVTKGIFLFVSYSIDSC